MISALVQGGLFLVSSWLVAAGLWSVPAARAEAVAIAVLGTVYAVGLVWERDR